MGEHYNFAILQFPNSKYIMEVFDSNSTPCIKRHDKSLKEAAVAEAAFHRNMSTIYVVYKHRHPKRIVVSLIYIRHFLG